MHFSTLFTTALLVAVDGALASFQPRPGMNLPVPRAGLPYGTLPYNHFGRRTAPVSFYRRDHHMKASAEATESAMPGEGDKVQVVQVGGSNGSLVFQPEDIKAEMGSFVQFQFNPMNHSVVQSTFDAPCMPMSISMPNASAAGFYSGFMPAAAVAGNGSKLTYTVQVTDSKPIWFYCSQGKHCQAGMVGAINAASSGQKTLAGYKQLASAAAENLSPGDIPSAMDNSTAAGGAGGAAADGSSAGGAAGEAGTGATGASADSASGTDSAAAVQQTTNAGVRAVGNSASGLVVALGVAAWAVL